MQSIVEDRVLGERELVTRMAARDDTALKSLWARHERLLYVLANAIVHNPAQAERAVSEAFDEAYRAADQFVPGDMTVLAWLTSLTRRRAQAIAAQTA